MSPSAFPLVVVALLMLLGGSGDVDSVTLLLGGTNTIEVAEDAVLVAGGETSIRATATEIFVVGGRVEVGSGVDRVTQLGGSLVVSEGAQVGVLRAYGGELAVSGDARIGRRETLEDVSADGSTGASNVALVVGTLLVAGLAARLEHRRPDQLANVAHAQRRHPVVSLAVGLTIVLTGVALVVFMVFTLVLIPISIAAVVIGIGLMLLGVVGVGHVVGRRLGGLRAPLATGVGTVATVLALWLVGRTPLIGDTVVLIALTIGIGASVVSLLGFRRFEPPELPETQTIEIR